MAKDDKSDSLDSQAWLWPAWHQTPDIIKLIAKHIDRGVDEQKYQLLGDEIRRTLQLIAERFEIIEHLQSVLENLRKHRRMESTGNAPTDGGSKKGSESYRIMLWEHDFAGFDFDIDALSVYLCLTCIDTINGSENYETPFDWLQKRIAAGNVPNIAEGIPKLKEEYESIYGASRRFREVFTTSLELEMRKALSQRLAVVKIKNGAITAESRTSWEKCARTERLSRIARKLYDMKSRFMHMSIRSLNPILPVCLSQDPKKDVLIMTTSGPSLADTLQNVVRRLVRKRLLNKR
jgi:hypothetical protein